MAENSKVEVRKALAALGLKRHEPGLFDDIASGTRTSVSIESTPLGTSCERVTWLTLNAHGAEDIPKGDGGNHQILARGVHPLLGSWIKSSCEYSSV